MNGNKQSATARKDWQSTSASRWGGTAKARRMQRAQEHKDGMDHGQGCTHCDMTHGR